MKVALITGASSGIGEALAYTYARRGYAIAGVGRNVERLNGVMQKITNEGGKFLPLVADVAINEQCVEAVETTIKEFGRIDVLIVNAGISMRGLFQDCDLDVLRKVMDINFWGSVYFIKSALPYILEQQGSIIAVSSITGMTGLPARTGYASSKFAMHGLMESLRMEYPKNALHVMISCPGWTNTSIRKHALNSTGEEQGESPRNEKKMDSPEKVADEIFEGMSKRKKLTVHSTVGKSMYWLSKFFPNYLEKRIRQEMIAETNSPIK